MGRYQAFSLPKNAEEIGTRLMVLDTSTGDLWQYFDSPGVGGKPAVSGITYLGKVNATLTPGETVTIQRFVSPNP
jgi:hypothetical protein